MKAFSKDQKVNKPANKQTMLKLPANHDLAVFVADWEQLDLHAEALEF